MQGVGVAGRALGAFRQDQAPGQRHTHGAQVAQVGRWRRPTAASERRHGRGTADPAPVRLALRTPVCPCCVRGVLVQFVVGVCVLGPLPAARARAVRARAVRIRAGRVVRLYSVRLPREAFTRQRVRAGDTTELCVEKGITLGIHVHTSTMNARCFVGGRSAG